MSDIDNNEIDDLVNGLCHLTVQPFFVLYRGVYVAERYASHDNLDHSHLLMFLSELIDPSETMTKLKSLVEAWRSEVVTKENLTFCSIDSGDINLKINVLLQRQKNSLENMLLELSYCVLEELKSLASHNANMCGMLQPKIDEMVQVTGGSNAQYLLSYKVTKSKLFSVQYVRLKNFYKDIASWIASVMYNSTKSEVFIKKFLDDDNRHLCLNFFLSTTSGDAIAKGFVSDDNKVFKKKRLDGDVGLVLTYNMKDDPQAKQHWNFFSYDTLQADGSLKMKCRVKYQKEYVFIGKIIGAYFCNRSICPRSVNNRTIVAMDGNGDCLFASLAHSIPGAMSALTMRKKIVDETRRILVDAGIDLADTIVDVLNEINGVHNSSVQSILLSMLVHNSTSGASIEDYLLQMANSGTWGGGVEIIVASILFNVTIQVHRSGFATNLDIFYGGNGAQVVNILYNGIDHYDAIE